MDSGVDTRPGLLQRRPEWGRPGERESRRLERQVVAPGDCAGQRHGLGGLLYEGLSQERQRQPARRDDPGYLRGLPDVRTGSVVESGRDRNVAQWGLSQFPFRESVPPRYLQWILRLEPCSQGRLV